MVRNSGKYGKPKRGGGKHFTSARILKADAAGNEAEGMWGEAKGSGEGGSSEEEGEEEEEEQESVSEDGEESDGVGGTASRPSASSSAALQTNSSNKFAVQPGQKDKLGNEPHQTKREAKKAAKAKPAGSDDEDDEDDDLLQAGAANRSLAKQMKVSSLSETAKKAPSSAQGMNRKEREEQQAKVRRENYLKATREGKTDEAKADLARLAKTKKEREEAAERKRAEKASAEEAKAQANAQSGRKRALLIRVKEAWRLNLGGIAMDWTYRRVMVLGSKGREYVVKENISYGSCRGNKRLDLYFPVRRSTTASSDDSDEPRPQVPIVVFIPGGGWAFTDKRYYLQLALTLRKKGLMVITPDITLYPEGSVKEMVSDIRAVLAWTGRNALKHGGNPSSIYLMGHGSGAHLSLLSIVQEAVVRSRDAYWLSSFSATTSASTTFAHDDGSEGSDFDHDNGEALSRRFIRNPAGQEVEISAGIRRLEVWGGDDVDVPPVRGLILLAGVSDVIKHIRNEFKSGIEQISPLRKALGPSHASCLMASPSHLLFGAKEIINTDFLPRNILLIHGGADRDIPIVQTVLLKTLLQGVGVKNVVLRAYRDLSHMECITALTGPKRSKYSTMIAGEIVSLIAGAEKQ
ncbi:MAG: hypothetical protein CYPHOPRED_002852 [Cyphobasidiales sp. Tagirdzhanova-0007]|nr:MAG: hypothetical protein CYPHOPRED_002852 [Cyphobasidiales sp. Tagirdzhanova-0007]